MMATKLSTRRICGISGVTLGLFLVTLLIPNGFIRSYLALTILIAAILTSVILQGWAKPRNERNNLVKITVILTAVVFQAVYFTLFGLKLGFASNIYHFGLTSIFTTYLPAIALIVLEEILREQLIERGKNSRLVQILTTVLFVTIEIITILPIYNFLEAKSWFDLAVVVALPSILKNIFYTYVAYYYDYRLNIAYRLIMELPVLILPIWPEVSEYLAVLFQTVLVVALLLCLISTKKWGRSMMERVKSAHKRPKNHTSDQHKRVKKYLRYGCVGIVVLLMVGYTALMSGLFKYHFLAIGSGSMEPNISRGDMILVEKTRNYDKMHEGDILVYEYSNVVMVHRIQNVRKEDGVYTFVTKGDANEKSDNWVINQSDIIGLAKGKIAMFGFPTLWLNELFNKGSNG